MSLSNAEDFGNPLQRYLWENRLIVVQCADSDVMEMVRAFQASSDALDERHILWFVLSDGDLQSSETAELPEGFADAVRFRLFDGAANGVQVALIGKDGGIKSVDEALNLKEIFGRVDAMPMRIQEMRELLD